MRFKWFKWFKLSPKPAPALGTFYCRGCGTCCKSFVVHLTHFDVYRMMDHTQLDPRSFLQLTQPDSDQEPEAFTYVYQRRCLALKHVVLDTPYTCIFLKDDLCSIQPAKPGVCQTWPLNFNRQGNISWISSHLAFMRRHCAFKINPKIDMASTYQEIHLYNREWELFRTLIREWNTYYEKQTQAEEFVIEATEMSFIEYFLQRRPQEEAKRQQWKLNF